MDVFWINLFLILVLCSMATIFGKEKNNDLLKEIISVKPNKLLASFACASLVLLSGLRATDGSVIGDTGGYVLSFNALPESVLQVGPFLHSDSDKGFIILSAIIKSFISTDPQIFLLICALITNGLIFMTLYKYAEPFYIAPYLYVTWGAYLVTMNGMRQSLAAGILLIGTKFLVDGNWKVFFLIVLFASTFHTSALLYIAFYFIVRQEAWSKKTGWIISLSLFGFLSFSLLMPAFFAVLSGTKYGHYEGTFGNDENSFGGANVFRVVFAAIPLFPAYLGRNRLKRIWPNSNIFVNLSLLNLVFMLFATHNVMFARLSVYFNMYNFILLPWAMRAFFDNRKLRYFAYYLIIVAFFIYYYKEMVLSLNIKYFSKYISF